MFINKKIVLTKLGKQMIERIIEIENKAYLCISERYLDMVFKAKVLEN